MTYPNIAFIGKAGAGKTTAARVLTERFPDLGYQPISFAEPIKVMLNTPNDRHRLQEFGTDIVRRYEPHAWVRLFLWQLNLKSLERIAISYLKTDEPVRWVNDDCRFPNELETLRDEGWVIVRVNCLEMVRVERLRRSGKLTDDNQLRHASETALDGIEPDYDIHNVLGAEDLAIEIGSTLSDISRRR